MPTAAYLAKLNSIEAEIKDEKMKVAELKKNAKRNGGLTPAEEVELESCEDTLTDLKQSRKDWIELIGIQTQRDIKPESKSFKDSDAEWTRSVTGVNTEYRKWTPPLDDNVRPTEAFKAQFEDIAKFVHMKNKSGRRFFLNLFLLDIVTRVEFNGRKISGIVDYTVGLNTKGLDMFDIAPPKELHLIVTEAKVDWGTQDFWQCVAETATLYKARKDAGKTKCSVWGVLSNAKLWQFVFINEDGILSQTGEFTLNLYVYDDDEISKVYRVLYYVVKCCFDSHTPNSTE
ncbi:hypothetical protein BCR33DRAFT_720927 [Rhizoclosmatium globosum]|uniref:Fungal-type protein kinase domain-containing protein n=1 Tax=Rhizoclosmatium globosum TaxID=329046 RepID=A0A1Y2BU10_9FUNG|nr:hypothetical protein BCR33DRAFT_720927 [Rhizoclosmatium globosum]|eukprot:ORY38223.1 hypothetical protein BCR33DRAFT_720927 [Rhizoclosmatium globosum]